MGTVHAKAPPPPPKDLDSMSRDDNVSKPINLQHVKARVDKIHIDGLNRTKDDIIQSQVKDLFKAKDFQDIFVQAYKVRGKLESLGCFKNIAIFIDTSNGPGATPEGVEVTFNVRECKRMTGGVSTMVGNNEASFLVGAKLPNLFGRGERLQMDYSHGNKNSTNIMISAIKPFVTGPLHKTLTASLFNTVAEYPWSGFKQNDKGFLIDFCFNSNETGTVKHNFQYEGVVRDLAANKTASFYVREQCGPTLKSSLKHIFTVDKRDATIFPTIGSLLQLTTEIAGLGGNIGFLKHELHMQSNWTLHEYLTFQAGFQAGYLRGISNDMKITIADSFFLGGPMNLRGFAMRGCGPRQEGNSLGGNMFWAGALHLYTPLPFKPGKNNFGDLFRLHGFINGGNVSNVELKFADSNEEFMKAFTENVRAAAGCGIAMKLGNMARIEINFVLPLLFQGSDILQKVQLGLGIQYL